MRIVTFESSRRLGVVQAMTAANFARNKRRSPNFPAWEEWVWQDQPSLEAAIKRHDRAFLRWRRETDAGKPSRDTY